VGGFGWGGWGGGGGGFGSKKRLVMFLIISRTEGCCGRGREKGFHYSTRERIRFSQGMGRSAALKETSWGFFLGLFSQRAKSLSIRGRSVKGREGHIDAEKHDVEKKTVSASTGGRPCPEKEEEAAEAGGNGWQAQRGEHLNSSAVRGEERDRFSSLMLSGPGKKDVDIQERKKTP